MLNADGRYLLAVRLEDQFLFCHIVADEVFDLLALAMSDGTYIQDFADALYPYKR